MHRPFALALAGLTSLTLLLVTPSCSSSAANGAPSATAYPGLALVDQPRRRYVSRDTPGSGSFFGRSSNTRLSQFRADEDLQLGGRDVAAGTKLFGLFREGSWVLEPHFTELLLVDHDLAFARRPGDETFVKLWYSAGEDVREEPTPFVDMLLPGNPLQEHERWAAHTPVGVLAHVDSESVDIAFVDPHGNIGATIRNVRSREVRAVGDLFLLGHPDPDAPGSFKSVYAVYDLAGERQSPFVERYEVLDYHGYEKIVAIAAPGYRSLLWPVPRAGDYVPRPERCEGAVALNDNSSLWAVAWSREGETKLWYAFEGLSTDGVHELTECEPRALWRDWHYETFRLYHAEQPTLAGSYYAFFIVSEHGSEVTDREWLVYSDVEANVLFPVGSFATAEEAAATLQRIEDELARVDATREAELAAAAAQREAEMRAFWDEQIRLAEAAEAERLQREVELHNEMAETWEANARAHAAWEALIHSVSPRSGNDYFTSGQAHRDAVRRTMERQNEQQRRLGLPDLYIIRD